MPSEIKDSIMPVKQKILDIVSLNGDANIIEEEHLGIFNGMLTTNVTFRDVLSYRAIYAPPYASSDFWLELRLYGEKVITKKYKWYPFEVQRVGNIKGIKVSSSLVLISGMRAAVLTLTLENQDSEEKTIPFQINIKGGLDYAHFWEFLRPTGIKKCAANCKGKRLVKKNESGAIVISTTVGNLKWEGFSSHWETDITLTSEKRKTFYLVVTIGDARKATRECDLILDNPKKAIKTSGGIWSKKIGDLFTKLPRFEATDKRLVNFYNRSLLHFLLNQWQVPEFLLRPYYSSGSLNGGCICCYLWDFGEGWEIFPLYDLKALREHIKQFLKTDITSHFAFTPITGEAFGPWYPVNQEKIIFSIYYYVLHTGDTQFLSEEVNGKTILDWAIYQAAYKDDFNESAILVDYGKGNNHLELRGKYRYDNYLPDLNGRRYGNYKAVHQLCELVHKKPFINFSERAKALKSLIKDNLWSKKDKWFFFLDGKMDKHIRYTIQIYKLLGSGVLDKEEESGILSHLNEDEFLSDYGMHSMSKKDAAYDQEDIDNGGGGSYISFPPQVIERLYKSGYPKKAEDILNRILWWGERLPYWGDSLVANNVDYRKDTPLINTIGALAGAQCIIFGMFGVEVKFNGDIIINPHPPTFSPDISLIGLKIRGANIDVFVKGEEYKVKIDNRVIQSKIGIPVLFQAKDKKLSKVKRRIEL